MIVKDPHLQTKLEIWSPKYSKMHSDGQWVVLLAKYKVHHTSPTILVEFTKAKHLLGQRFAIKRATVERQPLTSNGRISCYEVPFDLFEEWQSASEVADEAKSIFNK